MFAHQVVAGLNRKEPRAREWVYKTYYPDVLRTIRVSTAGSPDAEDLVSDVFLRLYEHNGSFDSLRDIKQFLVTIAKNCSQDHLRHREVVKRRTPDIEKHYRNLGEVERDHDEISRLFDEMMEFAARELSRQCRQVITLFYTYGKRNHQIARQLGISEKTVEGHKTVAYKKLKLAFGNRKSSFLLNLLL